ncbi:MAG: hypothetical protein RIQ53_1760 [Pseudomonadota bacterium]|jgi:putative tricarboxylic transport membrane protein
MSARTARAARAAWTAARLGDLAVGGVLGMLGLFIGIETLTTIPAGPAYAAVGPRVFPGLIAGGLCAVGLLIGARAWRGERPAADDERPHDWRAVGWIAAALAAQILLLDWLGWLPCAALVFTGVARAFGSRRWRRDALIGLALGAGTLALFNVGLGLELPLGRLIEGAVGH